VASNRVNGADDGGDAGGFSWAPWFDWLDPRGHWLRWLYLFVPVAIGLRFSGADAVWTFAASGVAIVPLAGLLGHATEQVARRLGPGIGGLLNATFGNAAELIIALFALFRGLDGVVKASLTGSIIGNLLLVLGAALLAGGVKRPVTRFNKTAAGVGATMLCLAAMGMLVPAIFHSLPGVDARAIRLEHELSVGVSLVLIATYGLHLLFSLVTHKDLFNPGDEDCKHDDDGPRWSTTKATVLLVGSTAFVAWMSEILVGAVESASHTLGLTEVFVGVIVVAVVGNAAEHSTAVLVAMKNQMDLALGIAMGSALQIALFVAPVLVFVSYLRGHPMDLLFTTMEIVAVILACLIARMVAEDGESNWLEGAMLLMIYVILGLAFFFLPVGAQTGGHDADSPAPSASSAAT
jgi:Ca2+:H+ antiporter